MIPTFLRAALAAAALTAATVVQAAPLIYTSQASFLAAVFAPAVDTFDDLAQGAAASPLWRGAAGYSYQVQDTGADDGFFNVGIGSDTWLGTSTATDEIVFSGFSPDVRGLGGLFFATDISGSVLAGQEVLVTAADASGSAQFTVTNSSFVGFVSSSGFTSLTVSITDNVDAWPTVNNLVLAVVPEPHPLALVATALVALCGIGWRRRPTAIAV